MKKALSVLIAVSILVCIALSLSSCGKDGLIGKWVASADLAELAESATEGGILDKIDFGFLSGNTIDLVIEFREDGTFVESFDLDEAKETVKSALELFLPSIVTKLGGSLDLVLKALGKGSVDEIIDDLLLKFSGKTGTYSFDQGKLRLKETIVKARLYGDELIFDEIVSFDEEEGSVIPIKTFPVTLTRRD